MEFERLTSQLVKWSSCRSWDASLKAFCRIEGATSDKKRGAEVRLTERVPRTQAQDNAQSYRGLSETTGALAINSERFLIVYWDCLQGSGASTLHAESKGSC